jgi:spermidine synthase
MLMGSTLPLLGRYVTALEKEAGHLVGKLYALNTLGAALGCFLAGFVLIRSFGVMGALYTAAALNLLVAFGGWFLSRFSRVKGTENVEAAAAEVPEVVVAKTTDGRFYLLVLAFFMSGLISIGYEIIWMRSIVHLLGGFTYVFSAVLTIYLLGNVIGAGIGSRLARRLKRPAVGFSITLSLLGLCGIFYLPLLIVWSSKVLPHANRVFEAIDARLGISPLTLGPLIQNAFLFLVPTLIMGIGFPIALQAWANHMHKVGRSTGTAYGANTIGAVVGGIVTGFVLIPLLGVQISISILGLIGLWIAGLMCVLFARSAKIMGRFALLAAAVILTAITAFTIPSNLFNAVIEINPLVADYDTVAVKEGVTTTVSLHRSLIDDALHMYSSGQSIAGDNYVERGDQKMLGHFGVLINRGAKNVLSVGFGSGETTACLALYNLESIDCVEIAPEIVDVSLQFYRHINLGDRLDKEINMVYMDAKNYIHLTDTRYDVIINDSIHPCDFAENASLYTKEYFESAREHLNKNGMIISWLPTYDMPASVFNSIIGTLMDVFPHVTLWYLAAHPAPLVLVAGSQQQQYFSPQHIENELLKDNVRNSLSGIDIHNSVDILSCYIGDEVDLRKVIKAYSLNSDYWPFVEFCTDAKTNSDEIFKQFVVNVRGKSIYDHIDWAGLNEEEKEKWVADYARLYEASKYLFKIKSKNVASNALKYSIEGLNAFPDHPALLDSRARAEKIYLQACIELMLSGQMQKALTLAKQIIDIYPQSAVGWFIGTKPFQQALIVAGQYSKLAPDSPDARIKLSIMARMLTHALIIDKKADFYGPDEAEKFAKWFYDLTAFDQVQMLDTFAAVYTTTGRYNEAIDTAQKAINLAESQAKTEIIEAIKERLQEIKKMRTADQQK